jgi:hypothetical protein
MSSRCSLLALSVLLVLGSGLTADHETIDPRGRPKQFEAGRGPMFAVWVEKGEWHIAVTSLPARQNKGQPTILTGSVWVEGDKVIGDWGKLEKSKDPRRADFIVPHKDENGFDFKFALGGGVDTVKFKGGDKATAIKFRLAVEGRQQPGFIYIGANGEHPSKAEFTLPTRRGN